MAALHVAFLVWLVFVATWQVAALWAGRAVAKAALIDRLLYFAAYGLGFSLLFTTPVHSSMFGRWALVVPFFGGGWWRTPLYAAPDLLGWAMVTLEVAVFAFAWWARITLGRLWSGMITLREGHRVVDTGPYRLVRHPIYTGFIGGSWTLALIQASPASLLGAGLLTVIMTFKAKREEAFLRRELGEADYDAYAAKTPMLVPFAPA